MNLHKILKLLTSVNEETDFNLLFLESILFLPFSLINIFRSLMDFRFDWIAHSFREMSRIRDELYRYNETRENKLIAMSSGRKGNLQADN